MSFFVIKNSYNTIFKNMLEYLKLIEYLFWVVSLPRYLLVK